MTRMENRDFLSIFIIFRKMAGKPSIQIFTKNFLNRIKNPNYGKYLAHKCTFVSRTTANKKIDTFPISILCR